MSSILNRLFPSLKSRLLVSSILIIIFLVGLTLSITYFSMDKALNTRIASQLETRFQSLEEEYLEELYDDREHNEEITEFSERNLRKAKNELREKIEEIEEVLEDRNEWIYLINQQSKVLLKSANAPKMPIFALEKDFGITKHGDTDIIYSGFEMPDGSIIVLTADLSEKNEALILFRNRFLLASFLITILGILILSQIIKSSLKGFKEVQSTADSIARGDYSHRVHPNHSSSIEVKQLASSFNNMIDRTQALLKEIKEVSNNVAHDLRTPLTRIRGKVETTLMANAELDEHKELSGIVIEECDKLMLLINNMLTLAEYESGLAVRKNEKIYLKSMMTQLCEVFESVIEDKSIKISLSFSENELLIYGDTEKIQRSLSNLLDNAVKYTPENGEIKIIAKVSKGRIEIIIADSGCGISEEDQKRIFERFYRVEDSRTTPGNGLGLNLAKAFIENHGGKISVNSQRGKGSSFKVILSSNS